MKKDVKRTNEGGKRVIKRSMLPRIPFLGKSKKEVAKVSVEVETFSGPENFFFMGETERKEVAEWFEKVKVVTRSKKRFLQIVERAIASVNYDYWISVIEPSCDENGKIIFKEGEEVARSFRFFDWLEKAKEFSPEWNSELANLHELFLWYAWRIAKGYWSLSYVCNDSSSKGNYFNSPESSFTFDASGVRKVGGFADGVGNTCKLVVHGADFVLCGGSYIDFGYDYPVADIYVDNPVNCVYSHISGVIVLKPDSNH